MIFPKAGLSGQLGWSKPSATSKLDISSRNRPLVPQFSLLHVCVVSVAPLPCGPYVCLEWLQEKEENEEDEGSITASADGTAFIKGGVTYKVVSCPVHLALPTLPKTESTICCHNFLCCTVSFSALRPACTSASPSGFTFGRKPTESCEETIAHISTLRV